MTNHAGHSVADHIKTRKGTGNDMTTIQRKNLLEGDIKVEVVESKAAENKAAEIDGVVTIHPTLSAVTDQIMVHVEGMKIPGGEKVVLIETDMAVVEEIGTIEEVVEVVTILIMILVQAATHETGEIQETATTSTTTADAATNMAVAAGAEDLAATMTDTMMIDDLDDAAVAAGVMAKTGRRLLALC